MWDVDYSCVTLECRGPLKVAIEFVLNQRDIRAKGLGSKSKFDELCQRSQGH